MKKERREKKGKSGKGIFLENEYYSLWTWIQGLSSRAKSSQQCNNVGLAVTRGEQVIHKLQYMPRTID